MATIDIPNSAGIPIPIVSDAGSPTMADIGNLMIYSHRLVNSRVGDDEFRASHSEIGKVEAAKYALMAKSRQEDQSARPAWAAEIVKGLLSIEGGMEAIRKDVEGIKKDIEGVKRDVEGVKRDVEGVKRDVKGVMEDIEEVRKDVKRVSALSENRLIAKENQQRQQRGNTKLRAKQKQVPGDGSELVRELSLRSTRHGQPTPTGDPPQCGDLITSQEVDVQKLELTNIDNWIRFYNESFSLDKNDNLNDRRVKILFWLLQG